jgi:hypothetical protein
MGVPRPWVILAVLSLPGAAWGSDHQFDAFVAPSYVNTEGSSIELLGWHVSGAAAVGDEHAWLSIVADLSVHFHALNDETRKDRTEILFLAGPRFTVKRGHKLRNVFAHAIILGAVHYSDTDPSPTFTDGAWAVGIGYDRLFRGERWGTRLQLDYIRPWSGDQGASGRSWRLSAGMVYRFPFEHPAAAAPQTK